VSLRILEYAGDAPRWMSARYASVSRTGALSNINQTYIRSEDYLFINTIPQFAGEGEGEGLTYHAVRITFYSLI